MKHLTWMMAVAMLLMISCKEQKTEVAAEAKAEEIAKIESPQTMAENIYQFKVTDLYGSEFDFSSLKGKKVMVVNTASECGLTPQYENLQKLYDSYKDKNFVIVGFPANNFGGQEPGSDEQIAAFCKQNYGVSFPMMSKISVKGDDMHEVYQFLTTKDRNGLEDSEVSWNFQKYLLNESGELVRVVEPRTLPDDPSIVSWIEAN